MYTSGVTITIWWNYFDVWVRLHFYDFYCVLLYFFYLFCLPVCMSLHGPCCPIQIKWWWWGGGRLKGESMRDIYPGPCATSEPVVLLGDHAELGPAGRISTKDRCAVRCERSRQRSRSNTRRRETRRVIRATCGRRITWPHTSSIRPRSTRAIAPPTTSTQPTSVRHISSTGYLPT